jgi:hypothetical protein
MRSTSRTSGAFVGETTLVIALCGSRKSPARPCGVWRTGRAVAFPPKCHDWRCTMGTRMSTGLSGSTARLTRYPRGSWKLARLIGARTRRSQPPRRASQGQNPKGTRRCGRRYHRRPDASSGLRPPLGVRDGGRDRPSRTPPATSSLERRQGGPRNAGRGPTRGTGQPAGHRADRAAHESWALRWDRGEALRGSRKSKFYSASPPNLTWDSHGRHLAA